MENQQKDLRHSFGYLRVSSDSQIDGDGFDRQRTAILRWASANGVKIIKWFEERGVSGTLAERPALSDMMVALMSNGTTLVVVEKLDRIARDQMIQETIIQSLIKQGFELVSAASGEQDLCGNDPGRKLMRTIMGAIAEYDKTMIVLKLRAARQRMKAKNGKCEGRKLFGVTVAEHRTIERMRQLKAEGLNYTHIADALNAEGFQTQSGSKWFPSTVSRTLAQAA